MKKALKRVLSTVLSSVMVLSCIAVTNVSSVSAATYTYTPSSSTGSLNSGDSFTSISGILTTKIGVTPAYATFTDNYIEFGSITNAKGNLVEGETTTVNANGLRLFIEATSSKTGELSFTTSSGSAGKDIYILEKTGTGDSTADPDENPEKYYDTYTVIAHENLIGNGEYTSISGDVTKGVTYYYATQGTTPRVREISFTEAFGTYTFSGAYGSGNSCTEPFTLTDEDENSYSAEYSSATGGYVLTISNIYADTYAKGDTFTVTAPTGYTASTDVLTVDTITASGSTAKGYTYTASFVESLTFAPISYTTDYTFTGSTADNEYTGNVTLTNSTKGISLSIPVTAGESIFSTDKTLSNDLVFEAGDVYTASISGSGYTSSGSSTLTISSVTTGSSSSDPTVISFDGTICYLKDEFDYSISAGLTVDGQSEFSSDSYSFGDFTLTKDGTDYTASVAAKDSDSGSGIVYVLEADFTAARNTVSAGDSFTLTTPSGYDGPETVSVKSLTETSTGVYDVVLEDISLETHIIYTYKPSANELSKSYSAGSTLGGIDTTYLDIKPASDTKVKVYYSGTYYFSAENYSLESDLVLNGRYTNSTSLRVLYKITPYLTGNLTVTTNAAYKDESYSGYIAVLNSDGSYTVLGGVKGSSSSSEREVTASVEAGTSYYFITAGTSPDMYSVTIDQADLTTKAYTLTGSLGSDNEYDGNFAVTGSDGCYYTGTAYKDSSYYTINAAADLNGGLDGSAFTVDYSDYYTADPETLTAAYDSTDDSYTLTSGLVIKEAFSGTYTYNPVTSSTSYSAGSALPTNTDYLTVVVGVDDTSGYSSASIYEDNVLSFGNYTSISSAVNGNYSSGSHRGLLELTPALDGTLTVNFCNYIGEIGSNQDKQAYIAVKNSDGTFSVLGAAVYKEYSVSAEVNAGTTYYLITHGTTPSISSIVLTESDTPVSYTEYKFSGTVSSDNEYTDDFELTNNSLYFTATVSGSEYSFLYTVKDGTSYDNEEFELDIPYSYTSSVSAVTASAVSGKNEYTFDGSVEYLLKNADYTFTSALGSANEYTDSLHLTFNNITYTASVSGSAYTFSTTKSRDAFAVGDEFTISAVSGYEGTETVKITSITGSAVDGYEVELESIELQLVIYDFVITGTFGSGNEYNTPGATFSIVETWYENSTEATTEYVMTISDDGKSYSCSVDDLHSIHFSSTGGSWIEVVSPEGYTVKQQYVDYTSVKGDNGYTVTINGIVFMENTVLYTLTGSLGSSNEYTGSSFDLTYGGTTYTAEISGSTYSFDVEVRQSAGAPFSVNDEFTVSVPNGYTGDSYITVEALSGTDYTLSSVSFEESMVDYTLNAYIGSGNEYTGDSIDVTDGTNTYTLTKDSTTGAYSITVTAKVSADAPFTNGQSLSVVNPDGYTASSSSYTVSYNSSSDAYVISSVVFTENTIVYTLTGSLSSNEYTGSSFDLTYGGTTYTAEISGSTYSFEVEVKQSAGAPFAVGDQFAVSVPSGYVGDDYVTVEALSGTDYTLSSTYLEEAMVDYTFNAYVGDGNEYTGDTFGISIGTNGYSLTKDNTTGAYTITISAKGSAAAPFADGQTVNINSPEGYTPAASTYTVSYDSASDAYVISGVVFIENEVTYTLTGSLGANNVYTSGSITLTKDETTYEAVISDDGSSYSFDVTVKESAGAPFAEGESFAVTLPDSTYTGTSSVSVESLSGSAYTLSEIEFTYRDKDVYYTIVSAETSDYVTTYDFAKTGYDTYKLVFESSDEYVEGLPYAANAGSSYIEDCYVELTEDGAVLTDNSTNSSTRMIVPYVNKTNKIRIYGSVIPTNAVSTNWRLITFGNGLNLGVNKNKSMYIDLSEDLSTSTGTTDFGTVVVGQAIEFDLTFDLDTCRATGTITNGSASGEVDVTWNSSTKYTQRVTYYTTLSQAGETARTILVPSVSFEEKPVFDADSMTITGLDGTVYYVIPVTGEQQSENTGYYLAGTQDTSIASEIGDTVYIGLVVDGVEFSLSDLGITDPYVVAFEITAASGVKIDVDSLSQKFGMEFIPASAAEEEEE